MFNIVNMVVLNPEQSDHYNFLIPVMKALVEKCHDLLNMKTYCPRLPNPSQGPAFFDDFKVYCQDSEWRSFMDKQVWYLFRWALVSICSSVAQ